MKYLTDYLPDVGTGDISYGMSAGYVVVEENGVLKAQKLSFDGTTPQFDGVAEEITNVGIFETGLDAPDYNGSGGGTVTGSCKYYKCASVDTDNKTWSGYELVLADGKYTVSDNLEEGLIYSSATPVVGNVYTADALILCVPYLGWEAPALRPVFYAPLSYANTAAETGQAIETVGTVPYSVVDGISCANFTARSVGYLNADSTNLPDGNNARTISLWFYINKGAKYDTGTTLFSYGSARDYGSGRWHTLNADPESKQFHLGFYGYDASIPAGIEYNRWYHVCLTKEYNSPDTLCYLNGSYVGTFANNYSYAPNENNILRFGTVCYDDGNRTSGLNGNLAGFRVYNTVLSQDNITLLSQEFTPTNEESPEVPGDSAAVPYGYRLKMSHYDLDPVWEIEFVQDDLTATGKARTWTCTNDNVNSKIMYMEEYGGWTQVDAIYFSPDRTGFGTGEDPYPCFDDMGVAEITVIE